MVAQSTLTCARPITATSASIRAAPCEATPIRFSANLASTLIGEITSNAAKVGSFASPAPLTRPPSQPRRDGLGTDSFVAPWSQYRLKPSSVSCFCATGASCAVAPTCLRVRIPPLA